MPLSPIARYRFDLENRGFVHDPSQEAAVEHLQRLYQGLLHNRGRKLVSLAWLRSRVSRPEPPTRGIYFWGGVGRGKTYLLDTFYDSVPYEQKLRTHFHRFMRQVHEQLRVLKGQKNPLERVAQDLAKKARVICFDEFFVSDITDAMILGTLLDNLFQAGTVLVTTSNAHPDDLYRDGLQRDRFMPAIRSIHAHMDVIEVDSGTDYRLRTLEKANLYQVPLGVEAEEALQSFFREMAAERPVDAGVDLEVEGRKLRARYVSEDICWFDFSILCEGPRSQNDYLVLASEYHSVIVSDVPVLDARREDAARRFINLVDVFYDRRVKLVLSCAVPPQQLYQGVRLNFEFQRTLSRLLEMQSREYLALPHLP